MPGRFEGATSPLELLLPTIEPRDELPEPAPSRRVTVSIDLLDRVLHRLELFLATARLSGDLLPGAGVPLDRARSLQLPLKDAEGVASLFDAAPVILQQPAEVQTMAPTRGLEDRDPKLLVPHRIRDSAGQRPVMEDPLEHNGREPLPLGQVPLGRDDDRRRGSSVRETQAEGVPPVRDAIPGRLQDDEPGLRVSEQDREAVDQLVRGLAGVVIGPRELRVAEEHAVVPTRLEAVSKVLPVLEDVTRDLHAVPHSQLGREASEARCEATPVLSICCLTAEDQHADGQLRETRERRARCRGLDEPRAGVVFVGHDGRRLKYTDRQPGDPLCGRRSEEHAPLTLIALLAALVSLALVMAIAVRTAEPDQVPVQGVQWGVMNTGAIEVAARSSLGTLNDDPVLTELARHHAFAMAARGFAGETNPEGEDHAARRARLAPLFVGPTQEIQVAFPRDLGAREEEIGKLGAERLRAAGAVGFTEGTAVGLGASVEGGRCALVAVAGRRVGTLDSPPRLGVSGGPWSLTGRFTTPLDGGLLAQVRLNDGPWTDGGQTRTRDRNVREPDPRTFEVDLDLPTDPGLLEVRLVQGDLEVLRVTIRET